MEEVRAEPGVVSDHHSQTPRWAYANLLAAGATGHIRSVPHYIEGLPNPWEGADGASRSKRSRYA